MEEPSCCGPISGARCADALIASSYLAGPIPAGCVARWRLCSAVWLARTRRPHGQSRHSGQVSITSGFH